VTLSRRPRGPQGYRDVPVLYAARGAITLIIRTGTVAQASLPMSHTSSGLTTIQFYRVPPRPGLTAEEHTSSGTFLTGIAQALLAEEDVTQDPSYRAPPAQASLPKSILAQDPS